jgi:hypothetical protein
LLFGILLTLDFIYEKSLFRNRNEKLSKIYFQPPHAEIIIAGPCEPLWTIDPTRIELNSGWRCYNLASAHSDLAENYLSLLLYLEKNDRPKGIVFYLTPESLDPNYNVFNTYRFSQFLPHKEVQKVIKEMDAEYFRFCKIPFMRFSYYNRAINFSAIQGIKHYFQNKETAFFENGFEPPGTVVWDAHLDWFKNYFPNGYRFNIDSTRLKYLNKIDSMCASNKIPILYYESPVYNSKEINLVNRDSVLLFISEWAFLKNRTYEIFDSIPYSNQKESFISLLVLNKESGKLFSDSLGKYIHLKSTFASTK